MSNFTVKMYNEAHAMNDAIVYNEAHAMNDAVFSDAEYDEAHAMNDASDAAYLQIAIDDAEYEASFMNEIFDIECSEYDAAYDEAHAMNERRATALTIVSNVAQTATNEVSLQSYISALIDAVDVRKAYEVAKNAENDSMFAKLKMFRASVAHERIASIMLASNVDANLLNRQERINARFNEKSYVKVLNIAQSIARVAQLNIYTRAILLSVKCFEDNGMLLTQAETKQACTSNSRLSVTTRNSALIRTHKMYDSSTCSTQASSTNNALQAYGVLIETRDSANQLCFALNRENETTKALLALVS